MMSSLALALALALAPLAAEAEGSGAPSAASGTRALLDEKITLQLEKADLGQVLERLATLLGKTLILQPEIEGTVSLEVRETPVSKVLAGLQTSHALSIRFEGERMYVTKAGEKARGAGKLDDETLDRAFLSDTTLPRRPTAEKPKPFDGAIEFRDDAGGSSVWEIGAAPGTVTLPGCARPIPVSLLPGDAFDGVPRVVFGPSRGEGLARVVAPGGTVRPPDCSARFALEARASRDGVSKAVPVSQAGQYQLGVRILEAGAGGDEVLSAPRIQLAVGEVGTLESRSLRTAATPGLALSEVIHMNVAVLSASDADAIVACSVSVTRDVEPARGEQPVTIRVARADESLRLTYGKPERVTVSPTYGRGHSALVLEVTVDRILGKS